MALEPMAETIRQLEAAGLRERVKVVIGGIAVDEIWCNRVGANAYTNDAYEGLQIVQRFMGAT
jgi:dimethylamine corrinoid protein